MIAKELLVTADLELTRGGRKAIREGNGLLLRIFVPYCIVDVFNMELRWRCCWAVFVTARHQLKHAKPYSSNRPVFSVKAFNALNWMCQSEKKA